MLVLTRRFGESIIVGDDVVITVVRIGGDKIKLGVTAPREMVVDREEVARRKQAKARGAEADQ